MYIINDRLGNQRYVGFSFTIFLVAALRKNAKN